MRWVGKGGPSEGNICRLVIFLKIMYIWLHFETDTENIWPQEISGLLLFILLLGLVDKYVPLEL